MKKTVNLRNPVTAPCGNVLMLALCGGMASAQSADDGGHRSEDQPTTVDVIFGNERMTFDFYGDNIFRLFQDNNGGIIRDPEAKPEAQILVDNPRRKVSKLEVSDKQDAISITTPRIEVVMDKATRLISVKDLNSGRTVIEQIAPVEFRRQGRVDNAQGGAAGVFLRRRRAERTLLAQGAR